MEDKMKSVVAFVTGGSSGIGRAIVERIVKQSGKCVIVDLNDAGAALAETLGENATFFKADVTSEKEIKAALEHARQKFDGINAVINCAGIASLHLPYDFEAEIAHPLEVYRRVMDVNALGTFNVARLAAGVMAANVPDENQQRGVIINMASACAKDANAEAVAYAGSKGAVLGMMQPLARGFAAKGIRVVSISPGFTDTPLVSGIERYNEYIEMTIHPRRFGKPEEIAHLAQCIIENPFINAVNMEIDGGFHFSGTSQ